MKGVPDKIGYVLAGGASTPGEIPDELEWAEKPRQGPWQRIATTEAGPGSEIEHHRNLFS
jgi:hypothetical protein